MKALDYQFNRIEVPLTPINSMWFAKTLNLSFKWWPKQDLLVLFFPMEKKGPRRLENSGLPVLDCAILQCMSPAFRKTIPGLRRMYNSYAQFVWFDSLKYTRHFFTEDFIKSNIPLIICSTETVQWYFISKNSMSFIYLLETIYTVSCIFKSLSWFSK